MSNSVLINILIVVAIVCLVIYRQFATRSATSGMRIYIVLGALGLYDTAEYAIKHPDIPFAQALAVLLGLVAGAVIAVPRAQSMRLWRDRSGHWLRRGNVKTFLWWMVALAAHVVISAAVPVLFGERLVGMSPFDSATILLYVAVSLGVQAYLVRRRTLAEPSTRLTSV